MGEVGTLVSLEFVGQNYATEQDAAGSFVTPEAVNWIYLAYLDDTLQLDKLVSGKQVAEPHVKWPITPLLLANWPPERMALRRTGLLIGWVNGRLGCDHAPRTEPVPLGMDGDRFQI